MIRQEDIKKLSTKYQISPLAIAREYCQHNILAGIYSNENSRKLLFKGGTALRIIYQSPRFSEDLDFTGVQNITYYEIEKLLTEALVNLESWGLDLDINEAKKTTGGYLSKIRFHLYEYKFLINLEISFRQRQGKTISEITSIKNDYIHTYSIIHLTLSDIVNGKIAALISRSKPRDWYDLYFFLHNQMLDNEQKNQLLQILQKLKKTEINFKKELKEFLPRSHHLILKDFKATLIREISKNI